MVYKNSLIYFVICAIIFTCKESGAQEYVKIVSPKEMQKLIEADSVQLIDVRTPKEYIEGHIKNAQNIDFLSTSFSEDINVLDIQKPIFIYCRSGNRSGKSLNIFLKMGFTEIYDLEGGIIKWKAEGFEVESEF